MEALLARCAILAAAVASMGASYRTSNFIVEAPSPQVAEQIGQAAEQYRRELAIEWLGSEMRNWAQPCPITAAVGDHLGAGGATSFVFERGEVFGWRMTIQGSLTRILDSVLPHEVTHTIFATHFRQPLPRWADEGACTTVEHSSERDKQHRMLREFLTTGRGIAFNRMFAMREYPRDVMPLYSQGYSVARYLIAQGGKGKFLNYLGDGLRDENWTRATKKHYGFDNLRALQESWLAWVAQGSPELNAPQETPALLAANEPSGKHDRAQPETASFDRDDKASVYDLVAARGAAEPPSEEDDDDWRPRRVPKTQLAAVPKPQQPGAMATSQQADAGPAHQATRPQDIQRPGQVILEWSRPPGGNTAATAARPLPGPL